METAPTIEPKSQEQKSSWVSRVWRAIVAAADWLHHKLFGEKPPLSRAEKKERRKALMKKPSSA